MTAIEMLRRLVAGFEACSEEEANRLMDDARAFLAEHDAAPVAESGVTFLEMAPGKWDVYTGCNNEGGYDARIRVPVPRHVYAVEKIDAEVNDA